MKRGAEEVNLVELEDLPGQSEQKSAKTSPVEKSLEELLDEVFNGQYDNFRAYLELNNITDLNLSDQVTGSPLSHLGLALQSTKVTWVTLSENNIGDAGAKDFGQALKGTNVTTVDLSYNNIGAEGAKDFAACIPDTLLIEAELGVDSLALSKALEKNRDKLLLSPYYMAALRLLPEEEKEKYVDLSVDTLNTEEGRLRYAGGILMHNALPADVANIILGFLPLMRSREGKLQTKNFLTIAKEYHPNGLAVEENSNANKKRKN